MYTEFYGLREKPFNLTPSPRYLYLGGVHKEALALLTYGVMERKGFILLTGEVGTGKTTMVQALLSTINNNVECVHISNPLLSPKDLLNYLAFSVFKEKVHFKSKAEFLLAFENFLKACLQHQKSFVLVIDEAQKLSYDLLEEIRLLSNMETADEKLINIFLVGQPELNQILAQPRCRALRQRISIRYHIEPLDPKGTKEYIINRLKTAGASEPSSIFPPRAIHALYKFSGGYPRMINVIADNALLLGYAREKIRITAEMIKECYEDVNLDSSQSDGHMEEKKGKEPDPGIPLIQRQYLKWAAAVVFGLFLVFVFVGERYGIFRPLNVFFLKGEKNHSHELAATNSSNENKERHKIKKEHSNTTFEESAETSPMREDDTDESETGTMTAAVQIEPERPVGASVPTVMEIPLQTERVKRGDTLEAMTKRVYGQTDDKTLNLLQKCNPKIKDLNTIHVGQTIVFPPKNLNERHLAYTVQVGSRDSLTEAQEISEGLLKKGFDVYFVPANEGSKKKALRIAIGNFENLGEARDKAAQIVREGISADTRVLMVRHE